MEALESLGIDWKMLIAQVVNFIILLLILRKFLFGPIVKLLDDRRKTIEKGLSDAKKAEEQLAKTDRDAKAKITDAINEAEKIVKEAKRNAEFESQKILDDSKQKSEKIIKNAKELAKQEEDKIISSAKNHLGKLVIVGVEKILGEKQDGKEASQITGNIS